MDIGLRPVVELSFMPRDLARDPGQTVFSYGAIISPPRDWDRWGDLVGALAAHLVQRYGADEVTGHWAFEVWNEPNLDVFWSGTREEYFRLYDVSARAIKSVHPGLRVGGRVGGGRLDPRAAGLPGRLGRAAGFPVLARLRQCTARPEAGAGVLRPERDAGLVDRVGRHPDPLQPGRRHCPRRCVPAPWHDLGAGPDGGAVALGRLRPLRGARRAAGAVPRGVRAALGREPAQAEILGAGAARRDGAAPAPGGG